MATRTVIVILVASLVSSQGASIYSPLEDQFKDRQFPGFPYGIVPLVPYSEDDVDTPLAAPHPTVPSASQSPININEAIVVPAPAPEIPALTFTNDDIEFPHKISFESTDNDLALVMRFQANKQNDAFPSFTYGRLNDTFILEKYHYHFGHGEFHMVHYNSKYGNFDEAMKHRDGIAILFFFVEIPPKQDNGPLNPFQFSEKIFHPDCINATFLGKPISLEELLPNETDNFNHYFGSLTTPNFNEVVTWTFLDNHIALFLNGST